MKKLLILLTFWCTAITANASLITVDIEDKVYGINDTLTANIYISELEGSLGIQTLVSGFTFDFDFTKSLLDFGQVTFGDKLDVDSFFGIPSNTVGLYNPGDSFVKVSEETIADSIDLDFAQGGLSRFLLASIDFTVLGNGQAIFGLRNIAVFDDFATSHDFISGEGNTARLGNQVSVPEPSTIAIFALALLMLVNTTRKAKH